MNYIVTISSKNKISLTNFFRFFNKELLTVTNHSIVISYKQNKTARKVISILKSPHVNKTAQVHFGTHTFSKQILIFSYKPSKFFLFFKQIQSRLFPDVIIIIKALIKFNHVNKLTCKLIRPNNFLLNFDKLKYNCQSLTHKYNSKYILLPIKKLLRAEKILDKKRKTSRLYKLLRSKIISYLKIWDCYGESMLISSKNIV